MLDIFAGAFKTTGDKSSAIGVMNGGSITSFYGIRGTEDLGGGLKADSVLESYVLLNNGQVGRFAGDATYSGNAYVDLAGSFGTLRFGCMLTPLLYITVRTSPMGASLRFSPFMSQTWAINSRRTVLGDTGWDSSVLYESPSILETKFSLQATAPGSGAHNEIATPLVYDNGPLYFAAATQHVKHGPGITGLIQDQDVYFAGGYYTFRYARLFAS